MISQRIEGTAPHLTLMVALTIRGQTREVRIPVDVDIGADTVRARSVFKVKQTEFGIRPYRGGPGGTVRVADEVRFSIQVVAIR
jgi:polyisoprenoid-binding protein YceI